MCVRVFIMFMYKTCISYQVYIFTFCISPLGLKEVYALPILMIHESKSTEKEEVPDLHAFMLTSWRSQSPHFHSEECMI